MKGKGVAPFGAVAIEKGDVQVTLVYWQTTYIIFLCMLDKYACLI